MKVDKYIMIVVFESSDGVERGKLLWVTPHHESN
jgi:hypothetical protein